MRIIIGKRAWALIGSAVILSGMALLISACSSSPNGGSSDNDPNLIGTWDLTSVNGQPIQGAFLRWTFTAETVTVISDMDCVEVFRYSSANGVLRGLSVVSREGSQCGDDDGSGELGSYSVAGNRLTITMSDPELDPPTAVFVFTKV